MIRSSIFLNSNAEAGPERSRLLVTKTQSVAEPTGTSPENHSVDSLIWKRTFVSVGAVESQTQVWRQGLALLVACLNRIMGFPLCWRWAWPVAVRLDGDRGPGRVVQAWDR